MNNLAAEIHHLQNGQPVDWQSLSELEQQVIALSAQLISRSVSGQAEDGPMADLPPYEWAVMPKTLRSQTAKP